MSANDTTLIARRYGEIYVQQRTDTGYWNATAMCASQGKRWNNYWQSQETQEFLAALAADMGVEILLPGASAGKTADAPGRRISAPGASAALVVINTTGPNEERGTWVHQRVALDLARWCNAKFAVWVNRHVEELLTRGATALSPAAAAGTSLAASEEVRAALAEIRSVVDGHGQKIDAILAALAGAKKPPVKAVALQTGSDGQALLQAILNAAFGGDSGAVIGKAVSSRTDFARLCESLERNGLALTSDRRGPRMRSEEQSLFVHVNVARKKLLGGTRWERAGSDALNRLLLSVDGARKAQRVVDGKKHWGVVLPMRRGVAPTGSPTSS